MQFDVSKGHFEAIGGDVAARHEEMVEHWSQMLSALANAKLHAQNELNRLVGVCNRAVWGAMPSDDRAPSPDEMAQVLAQLADDARATLIANCRLAAEQRHLVSLIEAAEQRQQEMLAAEEAKLAAAEAEARERAEFEAIDAAGKEARYQAWRAGRTG
jgi:hypothetical protein